jgi:hypothetical protein
MADRYWVGGSGNWNATSTTNWATSSGGASGASAPTSADNVIFDADSNTLSLPFTVTVTGTSASPALCADFSTSALDGAMTLTMGATAFLDVYGSFTLPASNFSVSGTTGAGIRYKSTTTGKTLTTNGVSLGNVAITFDGVGGGWTLGSAYTSTQSLTINNGTFNTDSTSNYSVTCTQLLFANASNTRQIDLNASTITLTVNNTASLSIPNVNNLTFNAGTSTLILSGPNNGISVPNTNSITFYNVELTATNASNSLLAGINTYNNLLIATPSSGIRNVQINSSFTVSGTLTLGTANTAIRRIFMRSDIVGTPRTITAATVATLSDVDFRDIVGAGVGTWSGTRLGNCGGNTGITLDAAKTVYRVGTGNWSATQWSLSSGGSVDVNNFPLAQDTALFDTGTTTGTHTIDSAWNIGNLDMSALNVAVTLASGSTTPNIYGNLTLDADVTLTGTGAISFSGVSNQTITSAGKTFSQALTNNKPTTTSLLLGDALTTSSTFTLTQGTLNLNGYNLTTNLFNSSNTNVRAIAFGVNNITTTGSGTVWTTATVTNFSYTGTPTVNISNNSATATTVSTGAMTEAQALNFNYTTGTYTLTDTASVYKSVNFTGFAGTIPNSVRTIYGSLTISTGMTLTAGTNTTTFASTSSGNTITSAGKTQDYPITFNGVGGVWTCQDALTLGSTRALTMTNGTLNLNSGATSTVGSFVTSGTNQKYLGASTPGSQATISDASGTNTVNYLTIIDSVATGGATWNSLWTDNNVDNGNNSGWVFGDAPVTSNSENVYNLRSFTQPRRF